MGLTFLTFRLGAGLFAADIAHVREIVAGTPLLGLPDARGELLGLIDLRGEAIPVFDLAARLGIADADRRGARIVVLELQEDAGQAGETGTARGGVSPCAPAPGEPVRDAGLCDRAACVTGFFADEVIGVSEVAPESIDRVPRSPSGWRSDLAPQLLRTAEGVVLILDLGRLFGASGGGRAHAHP